MEQLNISTKQKKGKHLTYVDRIFLETCGKQGRAVAWIASALNTHRSAIYREIVAGTVTRLNSDLTETKVCNAQRGRAVLKCKLNYRCLTLICARRLALRLGGSRSFKCERLRVSG